MRRRPDQDEAKDALYVDEHELHRRIAPHLGWDRFRATVKAYEADDFPKIDVAWGGRYWPKVAAWLDAHNGVGGNAAAVEFAQDGPECFDAPAQQVARTETGPKQSAVLDRQAGRAGPKRVPRLVHSASTRGR